MAAFQVCVCVSFGSDQTVIIIFEMWRGILVCSKLDELDVAVDCCGYEGVEEVEVWRILSFDVLHSVRYIEE